MSLKQVKKALRQAGFECGRRANHGYMWKHEDGRRALVPRKLTPDKRQVQNLKHYLRRLGVEVG